MATTTEWISKQTGWAIAGIATIDSGETATLPIPCHGKAVVRLGLPTLTGTSLTFTVQAYRPDDPAAPTTDPVFRPLVDDAGNDITVTVAGADSVVIPELGGCYAFTIISSGAEASAREIEVSMVGDSPNPAGNNQVTIEGGTVELRSEHQEDTAATTGDWGIGAYGVVNATLANRAADNDWSWLSTNPAGSLLIVQGANTGGDALGTGIVVNSRNYSGTEGQLGVLGMLYNGTSVDRPRNNVAGTLLASAARTTTTSSSDQTNYNGQAVAVTLNVTVVPGVETLTVTIEAKDPVSGAYTTILTGAAEAGTGTYRYRVGTNITPVANAAAADVLGRTWRATVTHSASGSFTYSLGYDVMTA